MLDRLLQKFFSQIGTHWQFFAQLIFSSLFTLHHLMHAQCPCTLHHHHHHHQLFIYQLLLSF